MTTDKTPRQRFVEAMMTIRNSARGCGLPIEQEVMDASDAFADQECAAWVNSSCEPNCDPATHHECRAALRKEIGL